MNPNDLCVQTIAGSLAREYQGLFPPDEDGKPPAHLVRAAMEILFDLGKAGVRVVEPMDILESEIEDGTVKLLLRAE